jgi:cation:H+ antiporter
MPYVSVVGERKFIMELVKSILILVVGFVLLVKGADFFVDGASAIAKKLHIPSLIIGLTIVAMGTSLPELSVSVTAALANQNSLAISNVIGSNIFNLMVVLGICAVIAPIGVSNIVIKRDYPFSVFCAILMAVLGSFGLTINRIDGIVLLVFFAGYLGVMFYDAKKVRKSAAEMEYEDEIDEATEDTEDIPLWKGILFVVGGAAAVKYGGDLTVDGAVSIATMLGVTETLIGLTIVATGTSLPELVTSLVAARKKELDMAVGNVVGSNVLNILTILGIGSVITPIAFNMQNFVDICVLAVFSLFVWIFCATRKRIGRFEGAFMLICYAVYLIYICIR